MLQANSRAVAFLASAALLLFLAACEPPKPSPEKAGTQGITGLSDRTAQIVAERKLSPDDVVAALKTFMPSGRHDDYILFASGGHAGQVFVIGVPSMRLLREIGVFTPEPWQGYGYGSKETMDVLEEGAGDAPGLAWGDTHHPALSETNGDYDGQFLFINDKANSRVAVIDLRDFETKQIVKNPIATSDHGGTFVTPNTEYVVEGGQYAQPLAGEYAPISRYKEKYRGHITFWKFDRAKGRIDRAASFSMVLPPYGQDLCDAGKKESEGWVFCNSFNTEQATGGIEEGKPPLEAGASQRDTDYLHVIDLKKAEAVYKAGKTVAMNGFPVIPLKTAIDEGILFFISEPKSPHGADVAPRGDYVVVSGKLDPQATVYSFKKIQEAIAAKKHTSDEYGVPVLDFDTVKEAQVELGLGPLHTQFDDKGYAYTSLFLDSAVARWKLGPPYHPDGWKLEGKINVHYNVGHISAAEGDTQNPAGRYLVALNKWSVDRFFPPGPLLPQNLQLIDISDPARPMQLLYDMPVGVGEPHYAQIIKADKLKPFKVYPQVGWDPGTMQPDPSAPAAGKERVVRDGKDVEVFMTAVRSHFTPEHVTIRKGDRVKWHITNLERAQDATHGFAVPDYNINLSIEPGETDTFQFTAVHDGVFTWYCTEFCSALHLEMAGYLMVAPADARLEEKAREKEDEKGEEKKSDEHARAEAADAR
jgi:nitrous-oxide reductase